jgi:hypothetical protein
MSENNEQKIITSLTEENVVIPTTEELNERIEEIETQSFPEELEKPKELTEEEKKELYIKQLKEARVKSHPIKHKGNLTINQFPISYKKERKRKNKIQRQSRKANR